MNAETGHHTRLLLATAVVLGALASSPAARYLTEPGPPSAAAPPRSALSAGTAVPGRSPRALSGHPATAAHPRAKPLPVAIDAYTGPAAVGALKVIAADLDGAVTGAFDYVPDSSWAAISDPAWLLDAWGRAGRPLTLAVPMLPSGRGATLTAAASGRYDAHFKALAAALVRHGLARTTLAIGWQPESGGSPWAVRTTAQAARYVRAWRTIHTAMNSVNGAAFTYLWEIGTPDALRVSPLAVYPGDRYVNQIGTTAFDLDSTALPAAQQWSDHADEPFSADWAAAFASTKHRPLTLMLGVAPVSDGGGGDNADYVTQALRWARRHGVVSVTLWDHGRWALPGHRFPRVLASLRRAVRRGELTPDVG